MTRAVGGAARTDAPDGQVSTFRGPVDAGSLGATLMHEHIFVRDLELERNLSDLEWNPAAFVDEAVNGLTALYGAGVRTVVDMTVIGLGRDVSLVGRVADLVPLNLVAATGLYAAEALPLYFRSRGPGRLLDIREPLEELFVRDIEEGIGETSVRAGMIKVTSEGARLTPSEERVLAAAAIAHQHTGVPITTHSVPEHRNGLAQQAFLADHGVSPARVIVGHSGDSDDLDYLRAIMDEGSTIGMDRFGMEHVLDDESRIDTVVTLAGLGYTDRMVLSHDAAFYSHVTPPSWRAAHAPRWRMDHLHGHILPALLQRGLTPADLDRMLVANPGRLLTPGRT